MRNDVCLQYSVSVLINEKQWEALCLPTVSSVAEKEGFEPSVPLLVRRISSPVHSTTLPPLRGRKNT